jgi:para-nitrobenzyl esterase
MRNVKVGALIFAVMTGSSAAFATIDDPVRLQDGLMSGAPGAENGVRVFKGIPFAAPPVGDFRWREPQPVAAWGPGHRLPLVALMPQWRQDYPN